MAALLFCLPPLTWTATGLLAGRLAARRGKSWRRGFALGFFCSTAGVVLAALPRRSSPAGLARGWIWSRPRQCGSVRPDRLSGRHAERTMLSGLPPPSAC